MEFPHLQDTSFPHIDNVNVWKYANVFDYRRWAAQSVLYLTNVPFDSSYSHVVECETIERRDSMLDSLQSHKVQLSSNFRLDPVEGGDTVKLPIPFDVAAQFNYLYIDIAVATSTTQPIAYESKDAIRRFCFFVENAVQLAPNTTQFVLTLDVWHTYRPYINIEGYFLERGHAPVAAAATPSEYLASPINKTEHLLAPDISFDDEGRAVIVKPLEFSGERLICFALPYYPAALSAALAQSAGQPVAPSPASYYDTGDRNGWQKGVNGYVWGTGARDYSNIVSPTPSPVTFGAGNGGGLYVYAIAASDAADFFTALQQENLNVLQDIQAVFQVNENWVTKSNILDLKGFTVWRVEGSRTPHTAPIKFTISDFDYPTQYAHLTKLYTSPYAYATATDNVGNIHRLNIQDLAGDSALAVRAILSSPTFKTLANLVNVGGTGTVSYTWTRINGESEQSNMPVSQFDKILFENDIPLFELAASAAQLFDIRNTHSVEGRRLSAITSYQNAAASANTGYENAEDSAAVAKANADRSASTSKTNADRSANTALANSNLSAATAQANVTRQNQAATANTALSVAAASSNTAASNSAQTRVKDRNNFQASLKATEQGLLQYSLLEVERDAMAASTLTSSVASIAGGFMSGGAIGAASAALSSAASAANAAIQYGAKAAEASASVTFMNEQTGVSNSTNTVANDQATGLATSVTNTNNSSSTAQTANSVNAAADNAARTRSAAETNAARANSAALANNSATYSTSTTNNAATYNVTVANADYSRDTSIENAKRTLETTRRAFVYEYDQAQVNKYEVLASASGDATRDVLGLNGYSVRLFTPKADTLALVGDYFSRYGYASERWWPGGALDKMSRFTFVKAKDVLARSALCNASTLTQLTDIIKAGVTVWRNIAEVNSGSIYDN